MSTEVHDLQRLFDATREQVDPLTLRRLGVTASQVRRRRVGWRWLGLPLAALAAAALVVWQGVPADSGSEHVGETVAAATVWPGASEPPGESWAGAEPMASLAGADLDLAMDTISDDGDVAQLIRAYEIVVAEQ